MLRLLDWLADYKLTLIVCLLAFLAGYARGNHVANLDCEAKISALQTAWSEQERSRAETVAAAEKSARERLAAETARGDRLAAELAAKTAELDAERASINRRIRDVSETARRDCAGMSADWVRLYNEALGLAGPGHGSGRENSGSGNAADSADTSGTAHARLQQDALATPEDVLAHIRDYGGYCRKLEAGYRALVFYYDGAKP